MPQLTCYGFPSKRYGWGWGPPAARQGWVVLVGFRLAVPIGTICIGPRHAVSCLLWFTTMSLPLLRICWLEGEPLRWRRFDRSRP